MVIRVDRDLSLTAGAARKADEGTIFLDGVAQSEPFMDLERRVYNLDHHEGCLRNFTLSTCEQALVLVARGLDLREKPWQVYTNDPDLDVVLAVWVLCNSMHLQAEDSAIRNSVVPLVNVAPASRPPAVVSSPEPQPMAPAPSNTPNQLSRSTRDDTRARPQLALRGR